jgi:hypothetical protein
MMLVDPAESLDRLLVSLLLEQRFGLAVIIRQHLTEVSHVVDQSAEEQNQDQQGAADQKAVLLRILPPPPQPSNKIFFFNF